MNNNSKEPRLEYKSDKCEVSDRYFIVGGQMAGCRHILTGLYLPFCQAQCCASAPIYWTVLNIKLCKIEMDNGKFVFGSLLAKRNVLKKSFILAAV